MTTKLFWQNPYQSKSQTTVKSVNGAVITLSETIFYAFTGGQESDEGKIGGFIVEKAEKKGTEIFYTLPEEHTVQVGDSVEVEIDWERRYALMRHHFAAELILELVYQDLGEIERIGAHISRESARLDFYWHENISKYFPQIMKKAEAIIAEDVEIISAFSDEANERRYWEVAGFARVPCAGTHLKRTGEVGKLMLKRKNPGKGKERVVVSLPN